MCSSSGAPIACSLTAAYFEEMEGIRPSSREAIEELQLRKLNMLLDRLREGSRFYRDLPDSIDSLEDLASLPFTTPDDVARNGARLSMVSQSEVARAVSENTSGTTGSPKRIVYTEADRRRTETFFAIGLRELIGPGDHVLLGFPHSEAMGLTDLLHRALATIGATAVEPAGLDAGSVRKLLGTPAGADARIPNAYIGLPGVLDRLCRDARSGKLGTPPSAKFPIERALLSGDACSQDMLRSIERTIDSKPFIHYGSREMGLAGAVDCMAHEGMHIRENDLLFEVVNRNGSPLPDGSFGELVVTTLSNEAMPLLRYRTADLGVIAKAPCPCGCHLARIGYTLRRI